MLYKIKIEKVTPNKDYKKELKAFNDDKTDTFPELYEYTEVETVDIEELSKEQLSRIKKFIRKVMNEK